MVAYKRKMQIQTLSLRGVSLRATRQSNNKRFFGLLRHTTKVVFLAMTQKFSSDLRLAWKLQHKKAQQLVEFLLVAPFLVIILGVVTEYAYALNINMTLTEGLKNSTSIIYSKIKPNMSASDIKDLVEKNLTTYLSDNNVPVKAENIIDVGYAIVGSNAVFMASYRYVPAFTLPNVYFDILPKEFYFFATSMIPASFLQGNAGYSGGYDSSDLDGIWLGNNFSGVDTYDGKRNGIMNKTIDDTIAILFLVETSAANKYAIVNWKGKMDGDCVVDTTTGSISGASCTSNGKAFSTYMSGKSVLNVIFVHDSILSTDIAQLQSDLDEYWVNAAGDSGTGMKISDSSVDGVLKRTLAIVNTNKFSLGNFDNIDVSSFNSGISAGNDYLMDSSGSKIFIHKSSDSITKIK